MIDLLGRADLMRDSEDLIKSIPMDSGTALWATLISACKTHSNLELGEIVAKRLIEMGRDDIGSYVLLSNTYATQERWDQCYVLRYYNKDCKWTLKASSYQKIDVFIIRRFNPEHTCPFSDRVLKNILATTAFVSEFTAPKLVNHMRKRTPDDIIEEIKKVYGVDINYTKAWRAKERAIAMLRGGSNYRGFEFCKSVVVVDGAHLSRPYKGTFFSIITLDGADNPGQVPNLDEEDLGDDDFIDSSNRRRATGVVASVRFKKKLTQCPNHKMTDEHLMEIFYRALNSLTKLIVDNSAGGAFIKITFTEATDMLERMTKTSRAWQTKYFLVSSNTRSSVISAEQRRIEEECDQDIAHMKAQMDLLMKHLLSGNIEKVKAMGSYGGFQTGGQGNQGWNHQGDWKNKSDKSGLYVPPGSCDNTATSSNKMSMEDMMEKLLKGVEATNSGVTTIKSDISSMSQLVNLHSIVIKQLEQQISQLSIAFNQKQNGTLPIEALQKMPGYAKFMKDLVTKKREVTGAEEGRPRSIHHPLYVGSLDFAKALCDLGASINLTPLAFYKKLGLGNPTPIKMQLVMADRSVKRPIGILHDVLVKVVDFIFPANFVILDCKVDFEVPIILGKPFLAIRRVLVDLELNELKFRLNGKETDFEHLRKISTTVVVLELVHGIILFKKFFIEIELGKLKKNGFDDDLHKGCMTPNVDEEYY
ncbi:hypothetical protein FXO38_12248 [Capsicum annuum]|nr:hypothetical protein FXO38_12248 [Capsicum annuum]